MKNIKISGWNETYKTKLNFKSTMNLSFGKCKGKRLISKSQNGELGNRMRGMMGMCGMRVGMLGIRVGIIFQINL